MARPAKPPTFKCINCPNRTTGVLLCDSCYAATQPYRPDAREPERPRAGADRRRKGGPARSE